MTYTYVCFIQVSILVLCSASCIYDRIQNKDPVRTVINYGYERNELHTSENIYRSKRATRTGQSLYEPIRITPLFYDLDKELLDIYQEGLRNVVKKAVTKASSLFSVVPVQGPLLLSRSEDACQIFYHGNNTKRCAKKHPNYDGEKCSNNEFKIPDDHLEGLFIYSGSDPNPRVEIPKGKGLPNTDFVLYVRSLSLQNCLQGGADVIAYAAYCQVDQKYRPVAGYINFCPALIRKADYDEERVFLTALHEIFHALGFSKDLFNHFQDCVEQPNKGVYCSNKPTSVKSILNALRLVSPKVVEATSEHYNCRSHATVNEFGPMLQTSQGGKVHSHWDSAFLQGSIMSPTIGSPHLTFLDPITLAYFEDTGWYQVDYSQADSYKWGKSKGCNFGLYPDCLQPNEYFCDKRDESGCHFLHKDKAVCVTDPYLHNCQIFKPKDSCQSVQSTVNPDVIQKHGEVYSQNSRCFISNITKDMMSSTETEGRCYMYGCMNGTVRIKVGSAPWCICPAGQSIKIPGFYGIIQCPEAGILCSEGDIDASPYPEPESEPTSDPSKITTTDNGMMGRICLELIFSSAHYSILESMDLVTDFEDACTQEIVKHTRLAEKRIADKLVFDGSVHFQFDILPQEMMSEMEGPSVTFAVSILKQTVTQGNFSFNVDGLMFTASEIKEVQNVPKLSKPNVQVGTIVGITFATLILIAIMVIVIFVAQRCYTIRARLLAHQTHRRARRNGTVNHYGNEGYDESTDARNTEQIQADYLPIASAVAATEQQRQQQNNNSSVVISNRRSSGPFIISRFQDSNGNNSQVEYNESSIDNHGDSHCHQNRYVDKHPGNENDNEIILKTKKTYSRHCCQSDSSKSITMKSKESIKITNPTSQNQCRTSLTSIGSFTTDIPPYPVPTISGLQSNSSLPPVNHTVQFPTHKLSSASLNVPIHRLSSCSNNSSVITISTGGDNCHQYHHHDKNHEGRDSAGGDYGESLSQSRGSSTVSAQDIGLIHPSTPSLHNESHRTSFSSDSDISYIS